MTAGSTVAGISPREPALHSDFPCSCTRVPPAERFGARLAKAHFRELSLLAHSFICQILRLPYGYLPIPEVRFPRRTVLDSVAQYDLKSDTLKFHPNCPSGIEGVEAVGEEVGHYIHCKLRGHLVSERRTAAFDTGLQVGRFIVLSNYMEAVGHYAGLAFAQHLFGEKALRRRSPERRAEARALAAGGTEALKVILRDPDTPGVVRDTLYPFGYDLAVSAYSMYGDEKLPVYFNMSLERFVVECKLFGILNGDPWDILLDKLDLLGSWNSRIK